MSFRPSIDVWRSDEWQIGYPDLVIVLDCGKALALDRFLRRGRGSDNTQVFEQRYQEYLYKQLAIERAYQVKIQRVCCLARALYNAF